MFTILFVFLLLSLCLGLSINKYDDYKEFSFYNKARLLVADQFQLVEENYPQVSFDKLNEILIKKPSKIRFFPYAIFNLQGQVIYSDNKFNYLKGDKVNLKEVIQFDKSFYSVDKTNFKVSFIIEKDNSVIGFALFLIPREEIIEKSEIKIIVTIFSPFILGIFIVMILLTTKVIYLKKHILEPIEDMSESSKAIIEGNYNIPVVKAHSSHLKANEVEKLMYGFELMRDQLKEKMDREERLKRSQKELISCISHDLKTPISTIKAYSEGLRDGIANTDEKQKKYYDIIVNKAEILNTMIHDLLEHSNAELNELKIMKTEQYFRDYINRTANELKDIVEHQGYMFEFLNEVPNVLIDMDEVRITQVITNLIDNSMKYTKKDGGKIQLGVNFDEYNQEIIVRVKDNGNGINTEDMPFIFDKFYRAEKSRTMSIPGSGLGLSICKYIIEKHGGQIQCKSKTGIGTEFMFHLPISSK